jgi:hypothetical protein
LCLHKCLLCMLAVGFCKHLVENDNHISHLAIMTTIALLVFLSSEQRLETN